MKFLHLCKIPPFLVSVLVVWFCKGSICPVSLVPFWHFFTAFSRLCFAAKLRANSELFLFFSLSSLSVRLQIRVHFALQFSPSGINPPPPVRVQNLPALAPAHTRTRARFTPPDERPQPLPLFCNLPPLFCNLLPLFCNFFL